jgi:hypothetical protein
MFTNFGKLWETLGNFGKFWKTLGNFEFVWDRDLEDIPASEQTVTELRRVILATEQATSRTEAH